ncbi:hypothetical protein [Pollutibacter soli]|uniref:hypothetical protein n=1 Tax=Pollutibacter soli TaxID=3034157 RepID=UPI0030136D1F
MVFFLLFVLILFQSGSDESVSSTNFENALSTLPEKNIKYPTEDSLILQEYFSDSSRIGKKKQNKIEISIYGNEDSSFSIIKFYSLTNRKWKLRNTYRYEHYSLMDLNADLSDFNNDGLNDPTYISNTAARGANEIRRLFIYDKNADSLISIINSEDYPNLQYNEELKCIDAFMVYGGSSTVFLRLKKNQLKKFAVVSLDDGLSIRKIDMNGNEKTIYSDSTKGSGYIRFSTYKTERVIKESTDPGN